MLLLRLLFVCGLIAAVGLGFDCVGLVGFWCLLRFAVLGGDWFDSVCGVFLLRVIGLSCGYGCMLLVVLAVCSFA